MEPPENSIYWHLYILISSLWIAKSKNGTCNGILENKFAD